MRFQRKNADGRSGQFGKRSGPREKEQVERAIHGHGRVAKPRKKYPEKRDGSFFQSSHSGKQQTRSGKCARVQMLIYQEEIGSRHRHGKKRGHQRDAAPLCERFRKTFSGQLQTAEQNQKDTYDVQAENKRFKAHMQEAHSAGYRYMKCGPANEEQEKISIVRIERRV